MAQAWGWQDDGDPDDIDNWMVRRNAQLALGPTADAIARNLWNQSTQDGGDLYAGNPSDLTALGLSAIGGAGPYSGTAANYGDQAGGAEGIAAGSQGKPSLPSADGAAIQQRPPAAEPGAYAAAFGDPSVSELEVIGRPPAPAPHQGFLDSLNHDPAVRVAAGLAGYVAGVPVGVGRAGWHAIEGIGHGLTFVRSLSSTEGREAAWNEATATAHDALQYGRSVWANPARLGSDVAAQSRAAIHSLVPFTTPMADTALGEMGREFGIGKNAGEPGTNIVGLIAAPELAEGVVGAGLFDATRGEEIGRRVAQGFDEGTARYLSKRYEGMGDHAVIPRRQDSIAGIPTPWLKEVSIPDWIMNSPFNVSKPRGMSQGDFYEYHYGVDPKFYGAKLPQSLNGGRGWSGKRLGLERYSGLKQAWVRTPNIYKDAAMGVALGNGFGQPGQDDPEPPR